MPSVDRDVDRVLARFIELQLLDVDDEIPDQDRLLGWDGHVERHVDARHHKPAIFIHEIHSHLVSAFLHSPKRNPKSDRALRVMRGQLLGDDGVEGAEQV